MATRAAPLTWFQVLEYKFKNWTTRGIFISIIPAHNADFEKAIWHYLFYHRFKMIVAVAFVRINGYSRTRSAYDMPFKKCAFKQLVHLIASKAVCNFVIIDPEMEIELNQLLSKIWSPQIANCMSRTVSTCDLYSMGCKYFNEIYQNLLMLYLLWFQRVHPCIIFVNRTAIRFCPIFPALHRMYHFVHTHLMMIDTSHRTTF